MLIIDFDKQISIFAPGKCGSTALAYNLHHLTNTPNDFFRAERLKFIGKDIPINYEELLKNKEYFYSIPVSDSYLMYRNLYKENFTHYVFTREPIDRTISGFETVINWFYKDKWNEYQDNKCNLDELWSIAYSSKDYDYHIAPYLHRTKNLSCVYKDIYDINDLLKELYNIEGKKIPSVPLWTQGIDVENATHNDFTRDKDPERWDSIQHQINKFRLDCASFFLNNRRALISKDDKFARELELYDTIRSR